MEGDRGLYGNPYGYGHQPHTYPPNNYNGGYGTGYQIAYPQAQAYYPPAHGGGYSHMPVQHYPGPSYGHGGGVGALIAGGAAAAAAAYGARHHGGYMHHGGGGYMYGGGKFKHGKFKHGKHYGGGKFKKWK